MFIIKQARQIRRKDGRKDARPPNLQYVYLLTAFVSIGALLFGFNYLETPHWWRIPLAIQVVPAVILAYGCWFWVPPSPRWLAQQDRHQCAREVLARLHGDAAATVQMAAIADEVAFERAVTTATWGDMFKTPVLRVTLLGMRVQFFQQITGTNSILYYTPSLFERGGIADPKTANLSTGGVGIVLFASAWFPMFFFGRLGRKSWPQIGLIGMMCAMIGITANHATVTFPYLFYVFFNISWGMGSWTYATEIFPVMYRAKGNALSTMTLWLACYIVAQISPPIGSAIGWGMYIIYSDICVIAFVFVRYAMVETKERTLEEMWALFGIESKLAGRSGMEVNPTDGTVQHPELVEGDD
ncbi:hypothetical protein DL770_008291 [Monosporascus sp. CRB-9-2]|nr:hypothetical protein DL770_008291 [Monosporascus sp. CRB-9-2]